MTTIKICVDWNQLTILCTLNHAMADSFYPNSSTAEQTAADPPSKLEALLAQLDKTQALRILTPGSNHEGQLTARQIEILEARVHGLTYKEIPLHISPGMQTGQPVSEVYVRQQMEKARKALGKISSEDARIAFIVAKVRAGLPVFTNEKLSQIDQSLAGVCSDQSLEINKLIKTLGSPELKRMIRDSQASGPEARRARYGRYAVTLEYGRGLVATAALLTSGLAIGILLDNLFA